MFSPAAVAGVVGALTLAFLAQRLVLGRRRRRAPSARARPIASGFTSFVAHAGSPPIVPSVLPLRLSPIRYAATMAVFFAA